jgi:rfaE bifunctional protein nucleotidyltransferase chain/domain
MKLFTTDNEGLARGLEDVTIGDAGGLAPNRFGHVAPASLPPALHSKLHSLDELVAAVDTRRRRGRKIVFTNGCFDLLHVGHAVYLAQAKALGDLLVVGVNSDASVRRLKGPRRPVIEETHRLWMLAALEAVDLVGLFEQDTPREMIEALSPDILVKGEDYRAQEIIGGDFVLARGGQVQLLRLVDGISTTTLIESIAHQHAGAQERHLGPGTV